VNVAFAAPLDPLVDVAALSEPAVALQSTATPPTGFPTRSVTRTVRSAFAPATTAIESALTFTSADAGPAMPVVCSVAVLVPTIASNVFTLAVSLIVHVVAAMPEESLSESVSETAPLPAVGFQATGTPAAGLPAKVTTTLTLLALPANVVRSAFAESAATLNEVAVLPVVSGPELVDASLEHAAAAASRATRGKRSARMPQRHVSPALP